MTPERWQRIKSILDIALALPGAKRASYLRDVCNGDSELQREVESLIASAEQSGDFLEREALFETPDMEPEPSNPLSGTRIGPYKLVEEIGRGGMGAVYLATRDDDVYRKKVAIKILRSTATDRDFIRRFRSERQIMASLEHPNIARLLDGGATEDGLPYFVMEYIEGGRSIDNYCDEHRLGTRERLMLFETVCSAVHFAHQRKIIHRDIKPGNILVGPDGSPKLLDFGIAKILDPDLSTQTLDMTVTVLRMMTPEYASPEQVTGEPVTAATDVYSLGVLLYELLTGHRPYRIKSHSHVDLMNVILGAEPEKPSTAVNRIETITRGPKRVQLTPETVSVARQTDPNELRRCLSGDIDNIVLMAMRKEAARRYPTAAELAADIRNHLEGRPVRARKDTVGYRSLKLIQRHKTHVLWAGFALAAVGITLTGWTFLGGDREPTAPPRVIPFTSLPGDEAQPSFSPDGNHIAFSWSGENNENVDIYVRAREGGRLMRLTTDIAEDVSPTWSADGNRVAFVRTSRTESAVYVAPFPTGIHGKIADVYPTRIETVGRHLSWSPNGRFIAVPDKSSAQEPFRIVLIEAATGSKTPLTIPPDKYIGDTNPAFSPDGEWVSFIRSRSSGVSDLYVISIAGGEARRITNDNRWLISQTWIPNGKGILFSSNRIGSHSLWRVSPAGGEPSRLSAIGESASDPSYSRDGKYLAYSQFYVDSNIWQFDLANPEAGQPRQRKLISSTQYDSSPQFSPDGKRIAFRSSRSGHNEVWLADVDGKNTTQLTHFGGTLTGTPRWSPDGRFIVFDSRPEGQPEIYTIPVEGGQAKRITNDGAEDVVGSWSRDGKWIYFPSNRGGNWQVWKAPAEGGDAVQVTHNGGFAAFESPDGKWIYYAKGRGIGGLWRVPSQGGTEEPVIEDLKPGYWGYWAITERGIYYVDKPATEPLAAIYLLDLTTRKSTLIGRIQKPLMLGDSAFAVSPDGRYVLFSQLDQSGSDIQLADFSGR